MKRNNFTLDRQEAVTHAYCRTSSWAVVATVRAPKSIVDGFISHYLRTDADEIHIFFDDPDVAKCDPSFLENPRLTITACTDSLWRERKSRYPLLISGRPDNVEGRQFSNYLAIQENSGCDWILNIDVDELLISTRSVSDILSEIPSNVFSVGIKPLEAAYSDFPVENNIFDTNLFKQPYNASPQFVADEFRKELLANAYGFWGHRRGKGFFRRSETIMTLSCHFPKPLNPRLHHRLYHPELELLHFECMTYELFHEKRARRISGKSLTTRIHRTTKARLSHFKSIAESGGRPATRELFAHMNIFSGKRLERALEVGFLVIRDRYNPPPFIPTEFVIGSDNGGILRLDTDQGLISFKPALSSHADSNAVLIRLEPEESGFAYLTVSGNSETLFVTPDDKGNLVPHCTDQPHFFKYELHGNSRISLYSYKPPIRGFLNVLENGTTIFQPEPDPRRSLTLLNPNREKNPNRSDTPSISLGNSATPAVERKTSPPLKPTTLDFVDFSNKNSGRATMHISPNSRMRKPIRMYWWDKKINFGDLIGPWLVQMITHRPVVNTMWEEAEDFSSGLLTVGSLLHSLRRPGLDVWGAGSMRALNPDFIARLSNKKPRKIHAVRGWKTYKELTSKLNWEVPKVYGDPALLLPRFYTPAESTGGSERVSIVPHYHHKEIFSHFSRDFKVIDVARDPATVVDEITSSRACISTSLHGVIVAHAYEIPWTWLRISDHTLRGDTFKFEDFFSIMDRPAVSSASITADSITKKEVLRIAARSRVPKNKFTFNDLLESFPEDYV